MSIFNTNLPGGPGLFGTHDIFLFIASGILLNLIPGPDSLFIITRSVMQGVRFGIAAALGIAAGCSVHIVAAAFGLSAVLSTSTFAFAIIKFLGAVYLVQIGFSMLLHRPSSMKSTAVDEKLLSWRTIFIQGFFTNVLNPKVALFFLALVPQFIDPAMSHKAIAFLFLGAIFNFNSTLWCLFLAWSAARFGSHYGEYLTAKWFSRVIGSVFILLGLRLAFTTRG